MRGHKGPDGAKSSKWEGICEHTVCQRLSEYGHDRAVADGVNVGYEVYRIQTEITEKGSKAGGIR